MATRYNNSKIIIKQQTMTLGRLLPGMILTFNYSVPNVTDPKPILLFLHRDPKKRIIEGLNLNYLPPSKLKRLFYFIDFRKGETGMENLVRLKEDYFRIKISHPKEPTDMDNDRFYHDIIKADNVFVRSYRSYKTPKLSSMKVISIQEEYIHKPGGSPFD